MLATNSPAAKSNSPPAASNVVSVLPANDPAEKDYRKLMLEDDAAHTEIDAWIQASEKLPPSERTLAETTLRSRIKQRLEPVRKSYETFLSRYPEHANARVAFASFLSDQGDEEGSGLQLEIARNADPRNPAVWCNLGNYYGHSGSPTNSFACYLKAIELNPRESIYYQNLAITTYMFRRDAQEFFGLDEEAVMTKVMALYRKALALDPGNFVLATELAQTYYGFKPPPQATPEATRQAHQKHFDDALEAWQVADRLAQDGIERDGVRIHMARVNIMAGRTNEAHRVINLVTNGMYDLAKERLYRSMTQRGKDTQATTTQSPRPGTNSLPAVPLTAWSQTNAPAAQQPAAREVQAETNAFTVPVPTLRQPGR